MPRVEYEDCVSYAPWFYHTVDHHDTTFQLNIHGMIKASMNGSHAKHRL